jgi:hypothetical protein
MVSIKTRQVVSEAKLVNLKRNVSKIKVGTWICQNSVKVIENEVWKTLVWCMSLVFTEETEAQIKETVDSD